ncbi:MAG TPA: response regulator [Candidatus Acidoferrales bacterium]|nr:response regulator [Candidatus Acidoferrales bacterium]
MSRAPAGFHASIDETGSLEVSAEYDVDYNPKILVVEHEPETLQRLQQTLTQMGADLHCLESSPPAAERINREKFDAFFLDLDLPEISGGELAERIRWSKSNSRCPIVVITNNPEPAALRRCFRAGVNFFLEKPVTRQQLETLLNAARGIMAQERRRYRRVAVRLPIRCRWQIQSFPQMVTGQSLDISASGVRLQLGLTPTPGGVVQVQFKLPGDPRPFDVTARLARIGPGQELALTFVGLTQEQRQRLMDFAGKTLTQARTTPLSSTLG